MPAQLKKLNDKQIAVLRWIAEGCPPRDWPDTTHKSSALALSSRGMVVVTRRSKKRPWSAALTERGRYYLDHGTLPAPASTAQPGTGATGRQCVDAQCHGPGPGGTQGLGAQVGRSADYLSMAQFDLLSWVAGARTGPMRGPLTVFQHGPCTIAA